MRTTTTLMTLTVAALLAACNNSGKGLSVSAASRGTSAGSAAGGATAASIDAGNGLTIERLRLLVREVEVEGAPACAAAPTGPTGPTGPSGPTGTARVGTSPALAHGGDGGSGSDDDSDDCEIEGGPFLVDLSGDALGGGVHWVAGIDVPFGTYEEVKFKVNTISAEHAGADPGLLAMADAHASIIVDGTRTTLVDGAPVTTPFTFSTSMEVAQKREGSIVVDEATGANVTLDVDPSGWFQRADGTLLDPADPSAQGAILANIRASIRVLHDDDGDGHDDEDDEDDHGQHGPDHP